METPTALEAVMEHSRQLLELVEGAEIAILAERLRPTLEERDRLVAALLATDPTGPKISPEAVAELEALDRRIGAALARRREEAWLAASALSHRRCAPRVAAAPPPRFLDQTG